MPGCTRLQRRPGALFCSMHAERLRRKGNLGPAEPLIHDLELCAEIYAKVVRDFNWPKGTNVTMLETPCREYQGHRNRHGYGVRDSRRSDPPDKQYLVHRWVWTQINGPILYGLMILHRCDNPACFRFDHLFLGTQADNVADMRAKGRGSTKLTVDQVREIRASPQGRGTGASLGRRFNVSPSTIALIRAGRTWKHVTL